MLNLIQFSYARHYFRGAIIITLFHMVLLEASRLFTTNTPSVFFTKRSNILRYIRPLSMADGTTVLFTDEQPVISGSIAAAILQLKRETDTPPLLNVGNPNADNSRAEKLMAQTTEEDSEQSKNSNALNFLFDNSKLYSRRTTPMSLRDDNNDGSDEKRNKRLHNFSLLRGYNRRRSQSRIYGDVTDANQGVRIRPKRLHNLSILRGYGTPLAENLPSVLAAAARYASTVPSQKRLLKKRSLHQLSLLRSYSGKPLTLLHDEANIRSRTKKSLHQLSRLRSFQQRQPLFSRQVESTDDQRTRRTTKSLHGLALLRDFHRPFQSDVSSAPRRIKKSLHGLSRLQEFDRSALTLPFFSLNNKGVDFSQQKTNKRLHGLSFLRGFEHNTASPMFSRHPSDSAEERRVRTKKSLHNLSLLRDFDRSAITLPLSAHLHEEDSGGAGGRVRRRGKRVHNLSLLRYDGKLFQNMFAASPQDFQQKRFEQKRFSRLLHQLQQKKSEPATIYLYE